MRWWILVVALLVPTGASALFVECPDGTQWGGSDVRKCPCCVVCDDGQWFVEGDADSCDDLEPVEPKPARRSTPRPDSSSSVTVDRVWTEYGYGKALVTVRNLSGQTWPEGARVECIALDANGRKLGVNHRSWYEALPPGFEGVKEVPVDLIGADMESMKCEVQISGVPLDDPTPKDPAEESATEADEILPAAFAGLFAMILYFVPTIIAGRRKHPQVNAILLTNMLLGWTVIGWIAALVWSATAKTVTLSKD